MDLRKKYAKLSEDKQVEIFIDWIIDTQNKDAVKYLFNTIKDLSGTGGLACNDSLVGITEELYSFDPDYLMDSIINLELKK